MASKFCYKLTLATVLTLLLYSEGTLSQPMPNCATPDPDVEINNVRNLLNGLRAHRRVLTLVLLPSSNLITSTQIQDLFFALVELSELDEELDSLALELQDSPDELAATRAVLKGVLQESCNWLSLKFPDFNCTRMELKQLRAMLEAYLLSRDTQIGIVRERSTPILSCDHQWAKDNIRCGANEEVLEILNTAFAGQNSFTLDDC